MSTFGHYFRVTTFGESHGAAVGCILDGVPSKILLSVADDIQPFVDRRRTGHSQYTSPRKEKDHVQILSGIDTENNLTLGTPLSFLVYNQDARPEDYHFSDEVAKSLQQSNKKAVESFPTDFIPRPSHADYSYLCKYGIHARSGGGRSSARETLSRVIAGAVAKKILRDWYPELKVVAFVSSIGNISIPDALVLPIFHSSSIFETTQTDHASQHSVPWTSEWVDSFGPLRCPDVKTTVNMKIVLEDVMAHADSIGGVVTCVVHNVPSGWGEPCFDKLEAILAHAMMSLPASKGFDVGSGFSASIMRGSEHNDPFVCKMSSHLVSNGTVAEDQRHHKKTCPSSPPPTTHVPLTTTKNDSGGIQGGISNGQPIYFRVAFKPPATISQAQSTYDLSGQATTLRATGRHDPCVVPRAVPIVEAMTYCALLDSALAQRTRT